MYRQIRALLLYLIPISYRFLVIKKVPARWDGVPSHLTIFFIPAIRFRNTYIRNMMEQLYSLGQGTSHKAGRLMDNRPAGYLLLFSRKCEWIIYRIFCSGLYIFTIVPGGLLLHSSTKRPGPGPAVREVIRERLCIASASNPSRLIMMRLLRNLMWWLYPVRAVFNNRQMLSFIKNSLNLKAFTEEG